MNYSKKSKHTRGWTTVDSFSLEKDKTTWRSVQQNGTGTWTKERLSLFMNYSKTSKHTRGWTTVDSSSLGKDKTTCKCSVFLCIDKATHGQQYTQLLLFFSFKKTATVCALIQKCRAAFAEEEKTEKSRFREIQQVQQVQQYANSGTLNFQTPFHCTYFNDFQWKEILKLSLAGVCVQRKEQACGLTSKVVGRL